MRFIFLVLLIILTGCQTKGDEKRSSYLQKTKAQSQPRVQTQKLVKMPHVKATPDDGPPPGPQPKTFKAAVPTAEPISRYGNPGEYRVNGKKYEVLKTAAGYHARGTASWYGTKFHSKRTSSGEPYNLYSMTAAHKTLPLPTYVRVKNLKNGRQAIVKVNDRGPFHDDRIIDLSYGAAVKLGLLPRGTAPVEIEAVSPSGSKPGEAHFYLQAGAFTRIEQAHNLLNKVSKLTSLPLFIERYKEYYVVKAGPFIDKNRSEELKRILAHNGIKDAFSMLQ